MLFCVSTREKEEKKSNTIGFRICVTHNWPFDYQDEKKRKKSNSISSNTLRMLILCLFVDTAKYCGLIQAVAVNV